MLFAADHFTHLMTPYGLAHFSALLICSAFTLLPPLILSFVVLVSLNTLKLCLQFMGSNSVMNSMYRVL